MSKDGKSGSLVEYISRSKHLVLSNRLMYWIEAGVNARIEVADMSGALSSRTFLITEGLRNPGSLSIDFIQLKLHWSNTVTKQVSVLLHFIEFISDVYQYQWEQSNLDGSNRTQNAILSSNVRWEPKAVAFDNTSLYFTDDLLPGVYWLPPAGLNATIIAETVSKPTAIALYNSDSTYKGKNHEVLQASMICTLLWLHFLGTNQCSSNNGECLHICLPVPRGRVCKCSTDKLSECVPVVVLKPKSAFVVISKSLTLRCEVNGKGFSDTRVAWLHDDNVIASETLSDDLRGVSVNYTIQAATYSHSGSYVCKIVNVIGEARSEVATVAVVDREPCWSNPCRHKGSCVDGVSGYNCICPEGYTGNTCETVTVRCWSGPCFNGGTCIEDINQYKCLCPHGYNGTRCQMDSCVSRPCLNGGTCHLSSNGYICNCSAGASGANCETVEERACSSRPCLNGGSCVELVINGYICNCLDGFSGITCGTVGTAPLVTTPTSGYRSIFLIYQRFSFMHVD